MHNKINILFLMIQMQLGGSERLVHGLIRNIDRNYFNPSLAWFHGDKILNEFYQLEVPFYHIPKLKRVEISALKKISNIIRENNIHVVNAHHFMSMVYSFYGCKITNKCKLIYTEHSKWEIERIPVKWKIIGHYLLSKAERTIGVTEGVSLKIREKFKLPVSKIHTIRNGVDLREYSNKKRNVSLRNELRVDTGDYVVGTVANFKKIKNHLFLLKAFHELIQNTTNVKLLLIGQGFRDDPESTEMEIRQFIKQKKLDNHVILTGYRSDVPDLLAIMDIFTLTSLEEGLPISLIEAMAAGLPLVGTNVNGIRELISSGKNGFLVDVGNVEGLRNSLYTLISNSTMRYKLGAVSKDVAHKYYSIEHCSKKYEELFISLFLNHANQRRILC